MFNFVQLRRIFHQRRSPHPSPLRPLTRCSSLSFSRRYTHSASLRSSQCDSSHNAPVTFQDVGLEDSFVTAMSAAFPNVKYPSICQAHLIRSALSHQKCILLKDRPGSGKSLALVLALLNKTRAHKSSRGHRGHGETAITSIIIVPHRDLATQMYHWIERIISQTFGSPKSAIPFLARVLVRDGAVNLSDQLKTLQSTPPHILIATPQALLEGITTDTDSLQLPWVQTVAVDEADYLIPLGTGRDHRARERHQKKIDRHPSPTVNILNAIYGSQGQPGLGSLNRPQLILSSATLDREMRVHIARDRNWIKDMKEAVRIDGDILWEGSDVEDPVFEVAYANTSHVTHHALYITPQGEVKNLAEAVDVGPSPKVSTDAHQAGVQLPSVESQRSSPTVNRKRAEEFSGTPSPFDPGVIETVAEIFALDVVHAALLVLPGSASVERAVYDLQSYGVNAHGLDLLDNDRGRGQLLGGGVSQAEPTLLVSTGASTRGVDLPDLSHVFILGVPDSKTRTEDYLHFAGRTGRYGTSGTVVTLLNPMKRSQSTLQHEMLRAIYRRIGVVPSKLTGYG